MVSPSKKNVGLNNNGLQLGLDLIHTTWVLLQFWICVLWQIKIIIIQCHVAPSIVIHAKFLWWFRGLIMTKLSVINQWRIVTIFMTKNTFRHKTRLARQMNFCHTVVTTCELWCNFQVLWHKQNIIEANISCSVSRYATTFFLVFQPIKIRVLQPRTNPNLILL